MRILWLCHNVPYPPQGGVLQRNFHLLRQLSRHAEVHLLALRQRALCADAEALRTARSTLEDFCTSVQIFEIDWESSRLARLGLAASLTWRDVPYDTVRYTSRPLYQFLGSTPLLDMDLVHFDTVGLAGYRCVLPPRPAVLNHHNVESHMLRRRAANADPARRALYAWQAARTETCERRQAPKMACNLVVSELDQSRLRRIAPGARTAVVANGVDVHYFDGPENGDPANREIVFVGSHSWYPNGDAARYFLRTIWPRILEREPEAHWTVIGRSPAKAVCRAAERDRRIEVLGFVDDLRERVARAGVFVCPFREGGGSRLKVLDALAMRKAIVSTSVGAEGIPLEDGRHFVQADTPAAFAQSVVDLLRDPQRRVRLGRAGRAFAEEHFAWEVIGRDLVRAYEGAIAAANGAVC